MSSSVSIGNDIEFINNKHRKKLYMSSDGNIICDNYILNSHNKVHKFDKTSYEINTVVSIIYENNKLNIIPFIWRYSKKHNYSSLRQFGIIIMNNENNTYVLTKGITNININLNKKGVKYGSKFVLSSGIIKVDSVGVRNKKYFGYSLEDIPKNNNTNTTIKTFINFENIY